MALTEEFKVELFLRKSTGLVKEIGPLGSFVLPWASMAGSGITLYSIEVIYNYPLGSVPTAFLIVGIPTIISVFTFAMLGVTTPRAAGAYVWGSRFVNPFVGWMGTGWIYWLAQIFSIGLVASVMGAVSGTIFTMWGITLNMPALTAFGSWLSGTVPQVEFTAVIIVVLGLLAMVEIKHYMKITLVIWGLNLFGLIVSAILFATNNPSTVPAAWDHFWGAGSYALISGLATKYNLAGYVTKTTSGFWGDTFAIIAYLFWALTGYEVNAYVGGELRNPRASFTYFFTAGMIATVIWYSLVTWLAYNAYGNFILQYNYVYNLYTAGSLNATDAASVSSYMVLPSMPLFASSLGGSSIVELIGAWWFWPITSVIVTYLAGTRSMFGMSFDRMFPAAFGKVNDRTHTPVYAAIACMVGGLIVAVLTLTSYGFLASAANSSFWYAIAYLVVAITAAVLPFRRPDVWEKGSKSKVLGIPVMALIGVLGIIGMVWITYLTTIGISLFAWEISALWMVLGVFVFAFFYLQNERHGIKVKQIYGEIPPP
ncbi:MAG TPA: amino acid permease [archaeon]|nr:amino acid permease [archaeon]